MTTSASNKIVKQSVRGRRKDPMYEVCKMVGDRLVSHHQFDTYREARVFIERSIAKSTHHQYVLREINVMDVFYASTVENKLRVHRTPDSGGFVQWDLSVKKTLRQQIRI